MDPNFYTPEQKAEVVNAVRENGDRAKAARALNMPYTRLCRIWHAVEIDSLNGNAPGHFEHGVAPGYRMGKVTVQRNATGIVERTWERQHPNAQAEQEAIEAAVNAMCASIPPLTPVGAPEHVLGHLLTQYLWTDYHLGALCWHKEGGSDWDVTIAEKTGTAAMQALVAGSPASDTAIVSINGDWQHYDSLLPVTPTHGHVLDADSRLGRVVEVNIRLTRRLIALALEKHRSVILVIAEGNHDQVSSLWLRKLFAALYENEPRIKVHDSELPYYALQWGRVMLGYHHGHLSKNDKLPLLFASQFPKMWGETTRRYINTGHRHHKEDKEHAGCRVIQHPTLAARDAYAARGGWVSERAITAMTFHKDFGEVGTVTITPEMLEAA